jgi:hypothetical protein
MNGKGYFSASLVNMNSKSENFLNDVRHEDNEIPLVEKANFYSLFLFTS